MRLRAGVAIDLGTVNTLVWVSGRGVVVDEPSAIAVDTTAGKAIATGEAADALAGKEPRDIEVIHPLRDGTNGGQFMALTLPDGTQLGNPDRGGARPGQGGADGAAP